MVKIFCEKCEETMQRMANVDYKVNTIMTSPPYNTGRPSTSERSRNNHEGRYDIHLDTMTQSEYLEWTIQLFKMFDTILEENGVVLYNVSYSNDSSVNTEGLGLVWLMISDVIRNTEFTVADRIVWKKGSALPNNVSHNKLTRICEDVFVFVRKKEYKTFNCNKEVSCVGKNGQTFYKSINNFVEARNNDGSCQYNKATYSTELVEKLLSIYAPEKAVVYDPFMGTGTTAVACSRMGFTCWGSEISENQVRYANQRLDKEKSS